MRTPAEGPLFLIHLRRAELLPQTAPFGRSHCQRLGNRVWAFEGRGLCAAPEAPATNATAPLRLISQARGLRISPAHVGNHAGAYFHKVTEPSIQRSASVLCESRTAAIVRRPTTFAASEYNQCGMEGRGS